jgi:hypothetical protein
MPAGHAWKACHLYDQKYDQMPAAGCRVMPSYAATPTAGSLPPIPAGNCASLLYSLLYFVLSSRDRPACNSLSCK